MYFGPVAVADQQVTTQGGRPTVNFYSISIREQIFLLSTVLYLIFFLPHSYSLQRKKNKRFRLLSRRDVHCCVGTVCTCSSTGGAQRCRTHARTATGVLENSVVQKVRQKNAGIKTHFITLLSRKNSSIYRARMRSVLRNERISATLVR